MSISMGRVLGALVVLYAVAACDSDSEGHPIGPGSGGTDPQGQGGTDPQGQGGTDPQGQGGTDPQGQGGTDPQGQGGTDPQGQGGTAGEEGTTAAAGAGGQPSFAGAAGEGGAAGACTTESGDECPACEEGYVHVACGGRHCVCEREDHFLKPEYEALLACDLDEPCPLSTQQSDIRLNTWENGECFLEAMRDRTPGRYRLSRSGGDVGYVYDDMTIILDGSDEMILFDVQTSGLLVGNLSRHYLPGSCTLKSYEELDDCVAAGTEVSHAGEGDGVCGDVWEWTENCEPLQNPVCPSE